MPSRPGIGLSDLVRGTYRYETDPYYYCKYPMYVSSTEVPKSPEYRVPS